jgi:hypothetical protein
MLDPRATSGRGNHHGGQNSAQQDQTTSSSVEKANPGREARETAGRGAGAAQAGSEGRSQSGLLISLSCVPDPEIVDPPAGF